MVYESATVFPTPEGAQLTSPPPISTYGFQKLASEYFAKGAWEQYQLPYTIVRPFNCVGIGERRALRDTDIMSRQREARPVATSCRTSCSRCSRARTRSTSSATATQVRHYTYGGDLAHGIRLAMESPAAINDDFNLSTAALDDGPRAGRVHLARRSTPTAARSDYVSDTPFEHDVQLRVPDVRKAKDVLGFEATTSLDDDARRGHPVDPG